MKMKRVAGLSAVVTGAALTGVLAFGAGSALGESTGLLAPTGVTAAPGVKTVHKPAPHYKHNGRGLSYGSAADADTPGAEPDLIAAVATNGKEGYVLKSDLERADGQAASEQFTSPEEALAWQDSAAAHTDQPIPVYEQDGVTKIGEFVVEGN